MLSTSSLCQKANPPHPRFLKEIKKKIAYQWEQELTTVTLRFTLNLVIESFKDRRLKRLYETGDRSKIQPDLIKRVEFILALLDVAQSLDDIAVHSLRLHALKGDRKGFHSVVVRAHWRIIFRFEDGNVFDVELLDYH